MDYEGRTQVPDWQIAIKNAMESNPAVMVLDATVLGLMVLSALSSVVVLTHWRGTWRGCTYGSRNSRFHVGHDANYGARQLMSYGVSEN